MSEMGRASTITGVLNHTLDAGPLKAINAVKVKYYCPNCYGINLFYREVETGVFDVTCQDCNKHWQKFKKLQ